MFELTISDNKVTKKHVAYVNCKIENQNCFFFVYLVTTGALFFLNELKKKKFNPPGILLLNGIY